MKGSRSNRSVWLTFVLMLAAAASVVVTLELLESALATFAVYYLLFCLALPAALLLFIEKKTVKEGMEYIGLTTPCCRNGLTVGLVSGLAFFLAIVFGSFFLFDDLLLSADIPEVVEGWGIAPGMAPPFAALMLVLNGGAEELFWRGFIYQRLEGQGWPGIVLAALFYGSYHIVTVISLVGSAFMGTLFVLVIFAAGCFWGWSRYRFGSVWPALISHVLVTAGYLTVFLWRVY